MIQKGPKFKAIQVMTTHPEYYDSYYVMCVDERGSGVYTPIGRFVSEEEARLLVEFLNGVDKYDEPPLQNRL